jgi:4-diphosphocytidyl-2-C-methyl-D-erythritol kinase
LPTVCIETFQKQFASRVIMNAIAVSSPAKINLTLEVLNKRTDGFHNISTIFMRIPFSDAFVFLPAGRSQVGTIRLFALHEISKVAHISDEENLIMRAARRLRQVLQEEGYSHTLCDVDICYKKHIPMGAGLGGGSSNAATTLQTLVQLWNADIPQKRLMEIGAELGSDVPFFLLDSTTAYAEGRGEVLQPVTISMEAKALIIVCPGIHISTPSAYQALNRTYEREARTNLRELLQATHKVSWNSLHSQCFNDFEEPTFAEHPVLRRIKQELIAQGAELALMSGSGSSMFGLFASMEVAISVRNTLGEIFPDYQMIVVPTH